MSFADNELPVCPCCNLGSSFQHCGIQSSILFIIVIIYGNPFIFLAWAPDCE